MENEKRRLKILMIFFGTSYLLRAIFDVSISIYYIEFQKLSETYPGFYELLQSLFFGLSDVMPIISFFRMHDQVYGENAEGQVNGVQLQVDPQQQRMLNQQRENERHLQTVLLNIIEATESSVTNIGTSSSRTASRDANSSFNIERNFSVHSLEGQLYQEGFGNGGACISNQKDSIANFSEINKLNGGKKIVTHSESLQSMRQCGLLSKNTIRQIHSDIVTVEALSRLQASELQSSHCINDESKRAPDLLYEEQLIADEKPTRLSEELRQYNKHKNHFSKSTAEESDLGVRELETLLNDHPIANGGAAGEHGGSINHAVNNRKSKSVASLDFI